MPLPDRASVLAALDTVIDPGSGQGLVAAGLVQGLVVGPAPEGLRAGFVLEVAAGDTALYAPVRDAAEAALSALPGMGRVSVVLTAETAPAARPVRRASLSPQAVDQGRPKAPVATERPAHVGRVLAVASGKGGVGKSTVAVNLAAAFAARGLSVGLLDADVYGPSLPTMLGMAGKPEYRDGMMEPHLIHSLRAMSVGLLTKAEDAMIWRGPMASQALTQMLTQTRWGTEDAPLDLLVVDLPPGTGDAQLSLVQTLPLDGAVIVTTPQPAATNVARKGGLMFQKVNVPLLGVAENMSYFVDPAGHKHLLFGEGGGIITAEKLGTSLLGQVPLIPEIRAGGDAGEPVVVSDPGSLAARTFAEIAETLLTRLGKPIPGRM